MLGANMETALKAFVSVVFVFGVWIQEMESKEFLRVCYFTSWSKNRVSQYAKFDIKDVDVSLCTHILYAFAKLDIGSKLMVATEPQVEESRPGYVGRYEQFTNLKKKNSRLKTFLSVGGQYAGNDGFIAISENDVILKRFAKHAVEFLRKRNFDGLDLDWEYPVKETRMAFVNLLKALREAFDAETSDVRRRLQLSFAAPAGKWFIDGGYDIPSIARFVDFANLMTYDYHVAGTKVAAFNSPLYSRKDIRFNQNLSTNWTVHYYMARGLPASKVVVGVTGIGRRLVLANPNDTEVGSPVTTESRRGSFFGVESGLAFPEICLMLDSIDTVKMFDYEQQVPFLINGDDWVGYEDAKSLKGKVEWMLKLGVAGIMMWSLDQDDFTGKACDQGKYPLLTAIKNAIKADNQPALTNNVNRGIDYISQKNGAPRLYDGSASMLVSAMTTLVFGVLLQQ